MGIDRTNLGFGAELEDFDPTEWTPKSKRRPQVAPEERAARREVAEATGFRSREPVTAATPPTPSTPQEAKSKPAGARLQRRRRTGRNAQFNIKAKPETIEAFCAVADAQGWGLGETLEHAVILLQKAHGEE